MTKFVGNCEFGNIYWKKSVMENFIFGAVLPISFRFIPMLFYTRKGEVF